MMVKCTVVAVWVPKSASWVRDAKRGPELHQGCTDALPVNLSAVNSELSFDTKVHLSILASV